MRAAESVPRFADRFAGLGYDLATLLRRLAETGERDEVSASTLRRHWKACVREVRRGRVPPLFGFYVHVPYCLEHCSYCKYFRARPASAVQLERYVSALVDAFAYFAPCFEGVRFSNLIVGGGTPGILDPAALRRLLGKLFDAFAFDDTRGDRAFEFNPVGITPQKLRVLKRYGFRRISMGVQSLAPRVLDVQNRGYQTRRVVERAFAMVRDSGIEQLCVDLMAGLAGDEPADFRASFAALADLEPEQITVYPLVPPQHYVKRYFGGDFRAFLSRRQDFLAQVVPWMRAFAEGRGYGSKRERDGIGDDSWVFSRVGFHSPVPEEDFYDEASPVPGSIFGLGPGANSTIRGQLAYSDCGPIPERFDARERRYWAVRRDRRLEMARSVLMSMRKYGAVSRDDFRRHFGTDLVDEFAPAVERLVSGGLARLTPERLSVLPASQEGRFRCAVPFLGREAVRRALRADDPRAAPFLRVVSRGFATEFAVEHARQDEKYLRVAKGLGLRLVYAGEQQSPAVRSTAGREVMLRLARQAFGGAVRECRERRPAAVLSALRLRLRARAERRGLVCRLSRPVG